MAEAMLKFDTNELDWTYEVVPEWEKAPAGLRHADVPSVCTDSEDNVYLYCRDVSQIVVYDSAGRFLRTWGDGEFSTFVHGAYMTGTDELLLVDQGHSFVGRFTRSGELLQTIGPRGVTSDSGYNGSDYSTVVRGAGPYNRPAAVCPSPDGRLFVADGYGNARVHRFGPDGELQLSWGEPGTGPGEFQVPHGIWIQDDRVLVADRGNHRIQHFDFDGKYITEWRDVYRPQDFAEDRDGRIYVAEGAGATTTSAGVPAGRISVFDPDGTVLCRWSAGEAGDGDFMMSPHGIWVDSVGSVYISVNVSTAGRFYGVGGANPVLKFARA
jgi:hypothetical protein